jgi:hypothetical protein
MNRLFFNSCFVAGASALLWVGSGFLGQHPLALAVTLVIAAVYALGAFELQRFRQATASLSGALEAIPQPLNDLGAWLSSLPGALQNPVRLRIEGERMGLPGPALTPYLVGLLVMLGMLGTFLGMVATLNGAVFALEGTSDLAAMRNAFAMPIKGLGLAFGTSVAGVATSAMLGLMSALCRRERLQAAQELDSKIASVLRGFSLTHQRQQAYQALQQQAQALPAVMDQMQALMLQMQAMGQHMNERLLANQEGFHNGAQTVYAELARSVDQSLRASLAHSAQALAQAITPVVENAMSTVAQQARAMHERVVDSTQGQLEALSTRMNASADSVAQSWSSALESQVENSASLVSNMGQSLEAFNSSFEQRSAAVLAQVAQAHARLQSEQAASEQQRLQAWSAGLQSLATDLGRAWQQAGAHNLAQQQAVCEALQHTAQQVASATQSSAEQTLGEIGRLMANSEELVRTRIDAENRWSQEHRQRMEQIAQALQNELGALRDAEEQRGSAAVQRLDSLQAAVALHLTGLGQALEDPIRRLIETASEAPRAAAEVIGTLRREISNSAARDNELLEERSRILETLNALLASIHHASAEQRAVIDSLVSSSAVAMQDAGGQFAHKVDAEAGRLADIAAQVTGSALEVSSLGQAFGFAVTAFNEGNEKLIANLQRIEAAMDKSMARSDDQLAYYVAQAREVIDLSITSQKEVVDALRELKDQAALADAAA